MQRAKHDLTLFELPAPQLTLSAPGAARAFSGEAMEEVTFRLFNLLPGIENGKAALCPDGFNPVRPTQPVEIKSLRFGNKCPLYRYRLAKDDPDTIYYIGVHNRSKSETLEDIWTGLSETLTEYLIIHVNTLCKLIHTNAYTLRTINTERSTSSGARNGYQRKGYRDGYWNVPFEHLKAATRSLPFSLSTQLHGLPFKVQVSADPYVLDEGLRLH